MRSVIAATVTAALIVAAAAFGQERGSGEQHSDAAAPDVVSNGETQAGQQPGPARTFSIRYSAELQAEPGSRSIRLWLPVPAESDHQEVSGLQIQSNGELTIQLDPKYGNRIAYVRRDAPDQEPLRVEVSAVIRRKAYRVPLAPDHPKAVELEEKLALFLAPNSTVPVGGKIGAEARKVVRPGMSPTEKSRAMYDYLTQTFSYDKTVPGYGKGDAVYACDVRRGNCTDVHSLFIGMARSTGMPARFLMGFPLPPSKRNGKVTGYHCWAEFYIDQIGWVPVDIAEVVKNPARLEELYGGLDANRVHFSTGRDIPLVGDQSPGPQNYLIYPVGVVDGQVSDRVRWELHFADRG